MKQYPLTKGKFAIVDQDFYDHLVSIRARFYFSPQNKKQIGYAINDNLGRMHHLVLEFHGIDIPSGMDVDHINGDRLDNRFENLQIVTRSQNLLKKDRRYPNETGYLGVQRRKDGRSSGNRYRAKVNHKGRVHLAGQYGTPEEAARAHDRLAKELQGEFANLNFP